MIFEIIIFIGMIQFAILPLISMQYFHKPFSFEGNFLCELMNNEKKNKISRLIYKFSGAIFSLAALSLAIYLMKDKNDPAIWFYIFFSIFFIFQIVYSGQSGKNNLSIHILFLLLSFISHMLFNSILYINTMNYIYLIYLIIMGINVSAILYNIKYKDMDKDANLIVLGKISYYSLIFINIYFLLTIIF